MGILSALSKIKRSPRLARLRRVLNLLYYDPDTVILHMKNFDTITVDDCHFYAGTQIDSLQKVKDNPWFDGVRPDDVVLDIGANIGAITIPLAKKARKVFAVEPVYFTTLRLNVMLNGLSNVAVIPVAIGRGARHRVIEFAGESVNAVLIPFPDIIKTIGGKVDFLKLDCEGGEWEMEPEMMKGIREIRAEFHVRRLHARDDQMKLVCWLHWLRTNGYKMDLDVLPVKVNPYYSEMSLLRASLEANHG